MISGRVPRWRAVTLIVAAAAALLVAALYAPAPEKRAMGLVKADIPAGYKSLPITGSATGDAVDENIGCEGHGAAEHRGRLGPFALRWTVHIYKGLNAGPTGWSVWHPELGECASSLDRSYPPQVLHEDASTGLYVLEGSGQALAACRKAEVVTTPARVVTWWQRALAALGAAAAVMMISRMVERWWDEV